MSNDSFVHNEPTRLNHHGLFLSWLFLPPFFHELPNKSRKAKSGKNKNVQLFFFFLTIPSRLRCVRHHTCNRMNLWPVKFHNEKEKRGAKLRHLYTLDNGICWTDLYTSSKLHKVNLPTYSANVSSFFFGKFIWAKKKEKWPLRLEIDRDSFFPFRHYVWTTFQSCWISLKKIRKKKCPRKEKLTWHSNTRHVLLYIFRSFGHNL